MSLTLLFRAVALAMMLSLGGLQVAGPALAVQPEEQLADPALEARAREISKQLRCVVCDNQTIDESDAQVAGDMRRYVRKRLTEGASDQTIIDEMVEFYDEFVLMRPRFSLSNVFIWAAPLIALGIGVVWARRRVGPTREQERTGDADAKPASAPLTAEEEARLKALMEGGGSSEGRA